MSPSQLVMHFFSIAGPVETLSLILLRLHFSYFTLGQNEQTKKKHLLEFSKDAFFCLV